MRACFAALALMLCVFGCATTQSPDQLVATAENWVKLLDYEKYQDALEQLAPSYQAALGTNDFLKYAQGTRRPLGKAASRTLSSKGFRSQVHGRRDSQYFQVSFETAFEHKATRVFEHVILEKRWDGWKVASYVMR
jgi:Protein of unknown function (DUF4019)